MNHQPVLSSGQYVPRTQSSALGGMGMPTPSAGAAAGVSSSSAGASSYTHSPALSGMAPNRFGNGSMGWMQRQQQTSHFPGHYGSSSMSSLPQSVNHSVSSAGMTPSSPNYAGMNSPHGVPLMKTAMSPAGQHTTHTASASMSTFANSSPEWQQQIMCAEISRQSFAPHHHARAAALAARSSVNNGQDPKKGIQLPTGVVANGLSFPFKGSEDAGRSADDQQVMSPSKSAGLRTKSSNSDDDTDKTWSIIDMGGLKLKNIGDQVFRYTFLTSLFINHNNLTSISPAVVQLRNLTVLDASGNQLVMIPPELGMLTELRALFLFDNQLTVLPPELGTLYQLEMLGVEGNPLQDNLMDVIKQDGTQALIAFLRDSCPVPVPPPEREWITLDADVPAAASEEESSKNTFAVLSYNVLCEKYATVQMYGYTPSWALAWDYRKEFILQEIISYAPDICCLQELEMGQYEEYFEPKLKQNDYESIFWPKTRARTMREDERRHVDGCATFFNSRVYQLVDKQVIEFNQIALQRPDFKKTEDIFNRVMTKDNIAAVAMLEHRATGAKLLVANCHMHWDPEFRDVKLVQSAMLLEQLDLAGNRFAKMAPQVTPSDGIKPPTYANGKQIPTIVCGDFNSSPDSGVYEFMSQGSAPPDHEDFMNHTYGMYTSEGPRHEYSLRSAYNSIGELPCTNHTPGFRGAIDYIWYTSNTLAVSGLLGEVDSNYLSRVVGFPNAHFPSDHICILAEFKIKPPSTGESSR